MKNLLFISSLLALTSCYTQRPIQKPIVQAVGIDKVKFVETKKEYRINVEAPDGDFIEFVDKNKDLSLDYFVLGHNGSLFLYAKDEQGTKLVEIEQGKYITYFGEVNPTVLEQKLIEKFNK